MKTHPLLLLALIYLAFISLGLPDTILGVAWPKMRLDFDQPLELAGVLTALIMTGSGISGFLSGKVLQKFTTAQVLTASTLFTGSALAACGATGTVWVILLLAVPLGLGGGAVDAGLNNYVARHYSNRHMNFLHCCWGIGATAGPLITTLYLAHDLSWRCAYFTIGGIQLTLALLFFGTRNWWDKAKEPAHQSPPEGHYLSVFRHVKAYASCFSFLCYTGVEFGCGLWAASFLLSRGYSLEAAGFAVTMFWGSLTAGRFLAGVIAKYIDTGRLILIGLTLAFLGIVLLGFGGYTWLNQAALILAGLGLAPIYPSMMHITPTRFAGAEGTRLIGFQMSSACLGILILPTIQGWLYTRISFELLPWLLGSLLILIILMQAWLCRPAAQKQPTHA